MGREIERKFLVDPLKWQDVKPTKAINIKQGYLSVDPERSVRIRIKDKRGFLTIKSGLKNLTRAEFEYEIPVADAEELIGLCSAKILKKRFEVITGKRLWEVDVFEGENEGLIIAEIELEDEREEVIVPNWVGKEVTHKPQYYNSMLVQHPFRKWNQHQRIQHSE